MSNLSVDAKEQTIKQHHAEGQATYRFSEYKWEGNQLTLISSSTRTLH
jgi:hypothetical protein